MQEIKSYYHHSHCGHFSHAKIIKREMSNGSRITSTLLINQYIHKKRWLKFLIYTLHI